MHRLISRGAPGALPGYPPVIASLLLSRGVNTPEAAQAFLHPDESQLNDPFLMQDMDRATALIRAAAEAGQAVTVYGDYDCDGVCASVILREALDSLGIRGGIYIPSRQEEGYGLNCEAVRKLADAGGLLITVDCGITSVEEVRLARELGLRVIVTDHHTPPAELPPADAILHPRLGEYPCKDLCGAGVAYKLSCALLGQTLLPTLELCALATIADMVPLLSENRALAALGLRRMRLTRRPGLKALLSVAGIRAGEEISGTQAAFQLAPRVNACGRMETARIAVDLFMARDPLKALALAEQADGLNARRKSIEQRILAEADAQVQAMDLCGLRAIVVMGEGWESGVVGLVAGRLAERYGYPTVALSRQGDTCVGSARSACGVDLYQALDSCRDLYSRFGGHKQAAGLTLPAAAVEEFRRRLSQAVADQLQGRTLMPETMYDSEITLADITLELISAIQALEPFGMGNPAPVFLLRQAEVLSARAVGASGAHLKLTLGQQGCVLDAIAFQMGGRAGTLAGACDLAVTPVANTFGGRTAAECRVEAVGGAAPLFHADENAESLAILQEFNRLCRIDSIYTPPEEAAEAPAPEGEQGTLYLCRTAETARRISRLYPGLDPADGTQADPRAYDAVGLCGAAARLGPYRRVVLCDGALCDQETAALRVLYPAARIIALPRSGALQSRLSALRFDVADMRGLYVSLCRGEKPDPTDPRAAAMLRVLQSMELIDGQCRLLPMQKRSPEADPLYRLIQGGEKLGNSL